MASDNRALKVLTTVDQRVNVHVGERGGNRSGMALRGGLVDVLNGSGRRAASIR